MFIELMLSDLFSGNSRERRQSLEILLKNVVVALVAGLTQQFRGFDNFADQQSFSN